MIIEIIGAIGGGLYLLAFFETAAGKWNGKSFWYEWNNLAGSILLGIYAILKHAYANIVLNIIWGVVALYAIRHILIRYNVRRKKKKHTHYMELFGHKK